MGVCLRMQVMCLGDAAKGAAAEMPPSECEDELKHLMEDVQQ